MRNRVAYVTNEPSRSNLLVHELQPVAVRVDREAGHGPHHESEEVHDCADVVEDRAQPFLAEIGDDQTHLLGRAAGQLGFARRRHRERPEHELAELANAPRPDLLREVAASGLQHPSDLFPPRRDRMTARDQIERGARDRQRGPVVVGRDHVRAERPQPTEPPPRRSGRIPRPPPGAAAAPAPKPAARRRPTGGRASDVAVSGARRNQPGVAPARSILRGAPVEPAEVPAVDGCAFRGVDQRVERRSLRARTRGYSASLRAATNASWGTSTRPICFMRFFPSFCRSSSLRFRLMSPP